MDENNNLENPNLNNRGNQSINPQDNPYNQSTEENPYYNPYFQNTTIDNSPYFDNSNVSISNDIYNQTYMDVNNSQNDNQSTLFSAENTIDNNSSLTSNGYSELESQNDIQANNENNLLNSENQIQDSNEPLNLFDLNNTSDEPISNKETENSNLNNNYNNQSSYLQNDTNFEPTSNIHINPILSQNINQSNFEEPQNFNNNQIDYQAQELNNNQIQDFDNNQFNESQMQDYSNDQFNNTNQDFVNSQFEGNNTNPTNNFMNESSNSYGSNNDEDFRRIWMGTLYDKANRRKFSIPSFFFGGLYYLYRKLFVFGFLFLIISCIIPVLGSFLISSGAESGSATIPFIITFTLPIIINIIYGFVFYPIYNNHINSSLNKLKNEVQSPNQLIDEAKKRGETSIGFLLLGIVLSSIINVIALSTIIITTLSNSIGMFGGLVPQSSQNNLNTIANNSENFESIYESYNFYNNYCFEYDSSKWTKNTDNKLEYDNYTLSYIQSIGNITSAGFDINQAQGRSSFYTYLYNLFSSQIDSSTTTLELGSSSFIYDNGIYYSYFDLVYTTSIERCYFVLIPEDDIFIEFILSNNDTVIPDAINEEVIRYICSISTVNYQDNLDTNNINSTVVNETENNISDQVTSNVVDLNNSDAQSNSLANSSSNVTSPNNGMTATSNTDTNGISIMYNTMQ